jgi:triosephosphate isomerase
VFNLKFPLFVINAKNYREGSGERLRRFFEYAALIEKDTSVKIYIAPPVIDLFYFSREFPEYTISQSVDVLEYGSSTGHIPIKRLLDIGISASLLNHSENKFSHQLIRDLVVEGDKLGFEFIVCVDSTEEMSKLLEQGVYPAAYAIEPPELIGTGRSVSKYKPETVVEAVKLGRRHNIPVLCGAGIVNGEDVAKAFELGVRGILVASGVIKSRNPLKTMVDMASNMMVAYTNRDIG